MSYNYYTSADATSIKSRHNIESAKRLGQQRLHPTLTNPNYLILRVRRDQFSKWIKNLPNRLSVLDVGGRIQPYRPLVENRLKRYVAVDPLFEGLLDIIAVGEFLPFGDDSFDAVICTQVLSYVTDPKLVIAEIYRVLQPGGVLLCSAPAFFPMHHDERWRFLPEGWRVLLSQFTEIEIVPEGFCVAGFFRTINVCLNSLVKNNLLKRVFTVSIIPLMNIAGLLLDRLSFGNERLTTNFSVFARKQNRETKRSSQARAKYAASLSVCEI